MKWEEFKKTKCKGYSETENKDECRLICTK